MKSLYVLPICLIMLFSNDINQKNEVTDLKVLLGNWKLDMSPHDKTDSNFALMEITEIVDNSFEGTFYRKGVQIRNAQINTQLGIIYGSLVSRDNSGTYNTTFYYKDGILHGSTHAINRNFLAVWTATKN